MENLEISVWFLGKIFAVSAFIIYVVFASVVVRQVYLMTRTVSVGLEGVIKFLIWLHLGLAIFALLFVLVFL